MDSIELQGGVWNLVAIGLKVQTQLTDSNGSSDVRYSTAIGETDPTISVEDAVSQGLFSGSFRFTGQAEIMTFTTDDLTESLYAYVNKDTKLARNIL